MTTQKSFQCYRHTGIAVDPIHVGTGGGRLGRVDNTIVRDPATRLPKIPGSSLAGVLRAYVAMVEENRRDNADRDNPYYPNCAGQGQGRSDGAGGHCGSSDCKVCTVFGFARGHEGAGGFAGLASFSDLQLLLFPVATMEGPVWVTSPGALRNAGIDPGHMGSGSDDHLLYRKNGQGKKLNLGWLLLDGAQSGHELDGAFRKLDGALRNLGIEDYIIDRIALVSDKLFSHVVNSNLEVRTSVSIDPTTGAAQEGALFTYEALPRGTVLYWEVTCRHPGHFRIGKNTEVRAVKTPDQVYQAVSQGFPYLAALGIGGMGTRGMGRLRVLKKDDGLNESTNNGVEQGRS